MESGDITVLEPLIVKNKMCTNKYQLGWLRSLYAPCIIPNHYTGKVFWYETYNNYSITINYNIIALVL